MSVKLYNILNIFLVHVFNVNYFIYPHEYVVSFGHYRDSTTILMRQTVALSFHNMRSQG
jgi:hypothetical protein